MHLSVTVISTVLNEARSIEGMLCSLFAQTRLPDEIVIVDGGSSDGTWEFLQAAAPVSPIPMRVLQRPGSGISHGRNVAIDAASCDIIAATDAGVRLASNWLGELLRPFEGDGEVDVVSGFFLPEAYTPFQLALAAVTLPRLSEIDPARFWPSSRSVAFRRRAWELVGGYPEWLDYCEDLVFDFSLADAGCVFAFAPQAVAHFQPRVSLGAFFRQYFRYARGDGKADLWRYRHLARYVTYLAFGPILFLLGLRSHPAWFLGLAVGAAAMLRKPFRRLSSPLRNLSPRVGWRLVAWVPVLRLVGDVAKMVGYPVGVAWRRRHAPARPWSRRHF